MKSTKKVVAYALALSVASQALPSINVHADELTNDNLLNTQSSSVFSLPGINLVGSEISIDYNTTKESVGEVSGFSVKVYAPSNPNEFTFIDLDFVENEGVYSVSDSITIPSSLQDSDSIMVELYSDNGELSKVFGPKKFELVEEVEEVVVQTEVEEVSSEVENVNQVAEVLDTTAPSSNNELEYKIDSKNNKVMITQKGIYDLESGLDVHSVKAYVYPTGSEEKGSPIELDGNDFSDFTGIATLPGEDSVIEVYASDLAGNSSLVGSSVITAKDLKASTIQVENILTGLFSSNLYFNGDYYVKPGSEFIFRETYKVLSDYLTKGNIIINTNANDYNSGVVFKGTLTDKGLVADTSFGNIEIGDSSITTEDDLMFDLDYKLSLKDSIANGTKLYFWSSVSDDDSSTNYVKYDKGLIVDSKAPTAVTNTPILDLTKNSTLIITQIGVGDEATGVDDNGVYALVKNDSLKDPIKVNLVKALTDAGSFSGSVDLNNLGIDRGVFKVEVYARDKVGNEALISTGEVSKNMSIESTETISIEGEKYSDNDTKWFKYNSEIKIDGKSLSKDEVYGGAQIIINEDSNDYKNKVVAEFKIGSKEDLTNIENNPYFELVSKSYNSTVGSDAQYKYVNDASATLKFKDKAFNKEYTVWIKFYTNDGIESKVIKPTYTINTDYERPTIEVTKVSDEYLVKVGDEGSGLASVIAYDSNGAIITEDFNNADGTVVKDMDFATITAIDNVGNKTVFDVVNNKVIDPSGEDILPSKPTGQDSFIDLNGNGGNQNQGGDDQGNQNGGDENQGNGNQGGSQGNQGNDGNQNQGGSQNDGNQGGDNQGGNSNNGNQNGGSQNGGTQGNGGNQNGGNQGGNQNGGNSNSGNSNNGNQNGGNSNGDVNNGGSGNSDNGGNSNGGSSTTNPNNSNTNGDNGNNGSSDNGAGDNVSGNGSANGQTSNGGDSTNPSTNPNSTNGSSNPSATLPYTGGTDTTVLGLLGGLMSTLGYVLFRKRK